MLLPGCQGPTMYTPRRHSNTCPPLVTPRCGLYSQGQKPAKDRWTRGPAMNASGRGPISSIFLLHTQTLVSSLIPECSEKLLHFSAPLSLRLRSPEPLQSSRTPRGMKRPYQQALVYNECRSCARDGIKRLYSTPLIKPTFPPRTLQRPEPEEPPPILFPNVPD